ncbi:TetR/AcrR family transcriptional regulator [Nocardioides sp.]|uniref:TetR/AcrR family transcriptional regulator n=1 Tax=Nocardioides sp. TaxID=35761 RepID=UPI00271D8A51|nr:TetR/AcrR family transcriptional regulator [Nocardioides sp.]MDO9458408.1 TetR/AcrR family transcriptional regulator [Nocardioides sp.]
MTPAVGSPASEAGTRPRVEGDREQQILDATLDVLADVGYDRLTMDAVAASARASKATLYRRWSTKPALVIDALCSMKEPHEVPDTGTLRGDLIAMFCGMGGLTDERQLVILGSVITAIGRDQQFAAAFRSQFIGPKAALSLGVFERALERGEIRDDVDLDIVVPALPGIVLHRQFLMGEVADAGSIERVIDQIILPAVAVGPRHSHDPKDPT